MPRGIYDRKKINGKTQGVKVVGVNPIQVVVDEVNHLRAKAKKKKIREASQQIQQEFLLGSTKENTDKQELEHMRQYLQDTRRVLVDRVNTVILLLENLKSAL